MRTATVVLLLVLLASASAQEPRMAGDAAPENDLVASPAIAVLVYHPYPDASDPFGLEYLDTGTDAYYHRYRHLDQDGVPGFDFPHTVFDGIVAIEGIPDGDGPYVATQEAYQAAFESRAKEEAPLRLSAAIFGGDAEAWNIGWFAEPSANLTGEDLNLWVAVVEDPVHYEPPPALSNGVFVHPFVVRGITFAGPLGDAPQNIPVQYPQGSGPETDPDRLRAVAWVQQGPANGLRFDAHEVVQAVMETPDQDQEVASEKVVLMEMYSATWCDTCLFGDRVAEEMAEQYGAQRDLEVASAGYLRDGPWLIMIAGGIAVAAIVALPRLPGGKR